MTNESWVFILKRKKNKENMMKMNVKNKKINKSEDKV